MAQTSFTCARPFTSGHYWNTHALALGQFGFSVETIGTAFQYTLSDGTTGHGIPNVLPEFALPWNIPNAQGEVINLEF